MEKEEMVSYILRQVETSDSVSGDYVIISREAALEIARLLSGKKEIKPAPKNADGQILFYCVDCSKSFRAVGREDRECFEKWKYHTWYADCPECGREASQTDRYWR